ncbi:MAG TPA: hypothetical protein VFK05_12525 [Polyangiaceae bacterium]|nr:hypothetical protein [Polyangiaceae bacterium]
MKLFGIDLSTLERQRRIKAIASQLEQDRFERAKKEQASSVYQATFRMRQGDLKGAVDILPHGPLAATTFAEWRAAGLIDDEQLRSVLLRIFCLAGYPCRALPRATWLEWFAIAGFVSDNGNLPPKEPLQVWRVEYGRELGLSWTRNPQVIERAITTGTLLGLAGRVLRTHVPPSQVLGLIETRNFLGVVESRNEQEVIVHPSVRIEAVERVVGVPPWFDR